MAVTSYSVEFVGIAGGTLSVDKNERLVRLVIPAQDLEVVRKDLLPPATSQTDATFEKPLLLTS